MTIKTFMMAVACCTAIPMNVTAQQLPQTTQEAKPGVRWWWFGSAVDKPNLAWSLSQYASHGIGAVEITPIYGVQGNDRNDIPYLSDKWMDMLRFTEAEAQKDGIETDMATGTGWPFGGPWVPISEAACKAVFADTLVSTKTNIRSIKFNLPAKEVPSSVLDTIVAFPAPQKGMKRVIALYVGRTRQMVKRAAPGGEGYVIDHFDKNAVAHYLAHFDECFAKTGTPYPHTFFNDSYEVYGADWTPTLPQEFEKLHGYSLISNLNKLLDGDTQVVSDYRETLGEMLLHNFTEQWTAWAHKHGAITRNQAHGSPANLIDCYAAVDIPEIEGFGLTNFGIKGLRQDLGMTRPNYSDLSMLKYAPSAAHITGKKYVSSETFTWLTEHFRTSLSQMKPDLDLMFCAGVNHMFFHGTAYSPKDEAWPGWKFYASIDMSPTNSIWRDAPYLMKYITRCQTYLQWGAPDNDFLVYLPVKDMWKEDTKHLLMKFDIHSMGKKTPHFIRTILDIDSLGFDCDYISDKYLSQLTRTPEGTLRTAAGTEYRGLIIPQGTTIDAELQRQLNRLGSTNIIYGVNGQQMAQAAKPEEMKKAFRLKMIRRKDSNGYHYFIANLTPNDVSGKTHLAVNGKTAIWFNPMDSTFTDAHLNGNELSISLRSGESRILLVGNYPQTEPLSQTALTAQKTDKEVSDLDLSTQEWTLSFVDEQPKVDTTFTLSSLKSWEKLSPKAGITMGTGVYTTHFKLSKQQAASYAHINLGDVRESARVYINGQYAGCAWAVPFILPVKGLLHKGNNTLRIEVTNLPANRIAQMDRDGIQWRKMKEINIVNINYKKSSYAGWTPMPSGLNSNVILTTK